MRRDDAILAARSFLGTPYVHRGRGDGGLDCLGLLLAVTKKISYTHGYDDREYGLIPEPGLADKILPRYLDRIPREEIQPGDVVVIHVRGMARHFAVVTSPYAIIHSRDKYGVIEEPLSRWQPHIRSAWRLRDVS